MLGNYTGQSHIRKEFQPITPGVRRAYAGRTTAVGQWDAWMDRRVGLPSGPINNCQRNHHSFLINLEIYREKVPESNFHLNEVPGS